MADDDDREERDEDEDEEEEGEEEVKKPAPKAEAKPVKSAASAAPSGGDLQSELKKIRVLLEESREQQKQYLWLLLPIVAMLLIQTILHATRL